MGLLNKLYKKHAWPLVDRFWPTGGQENNIYQKNFMIQHLYLVLINKSLRTFFLYCNCLYCNFFFTVILGSSKKMSVVVHPTNIFLYFDNFLNPDKAKKLHSFCIARSIRYIATLIKGHSDSYRCHCFKCLLCRLN